MKKNRNYLYLLFLLLLPVIVFAEDDEFPLFFALLMEAFVSIHMTVFVLWPLSNVIKSDPAEAKKLCKKLFIARVIILLLGDFLISPNIAILDFMSVFIGAFSVFPIWLVKSSKSIVSTKVITTAGTVPQPNGKNCPSCGAELLEGDEFCTNCGEKLDGMITPVTNTTANAKQDYYISTTEENTLYKLSEEELLKKFLTDEMKNAGIEEKSELIPSEILKRKKVMNLLFCLLIFIYIILIFFHFPLLTYIIGLIILIIIFKKTRGYDMMDFLTKEVKARPSEKISNIVMNVKNSFVEDTSKRILAVGLIIAIAVPLALFAKPRIIYEKVYDREGEYMGYGVRFYAFGLTEFTTASIPDSYNGEPIVSLRGNCFSNMFFLKSVELPDSITEIRGQAFLNDFSLEEVTLPSNLETLGGGSFKNCKSLRKIEIPDTVTEFGGEMFQNATKLEEVKLSENITEIRGNSFENCSSLEEIKIPDKVTRIGGHAFYGCSSLSKVEISEESQLREIGSSAFRLCGSLKEITIPAETTTDIRSFKESPTVVHRYNESAPSYTKYKNSETFTLSVGSTASVYMKNQTKELNITLVAIYDSTREKYYELDLDGYTNTTIKYNDNEVSRVVNEDIELQITSAYSNNTIYLTIYYN